MSENTLTLERQARSCVVLANAGELISGIIREVAGNDVSNSINGSRATSEIVQTLAYQRIAKLLQIKAAKK